MHTLKKSLLFLILLAGVKSTNILLINGGFSSFVAKVRLEGNRDFPPWQSKLEKRKPAEVIYFTLYKKTYSMHKAKSFQ
jgi:hypothetical protein